MRIVHISEPGGVSAIDTYILSPALTAMSIGVEGAGMISHHAPYDAVPSVATSISVPAWISVVSVAVQSMSMHPPPMPIQADEYSASPGTCWVAVGTLQTPEI